MEKALSVLVSWVFFLMIWLSVCCSKILEIDVLLLDLCNVVSCGLFLWVLGNRVFFLMTWVFGCCFKDFVNRCLSFGFVVNILV